MNCDFTPYPLYFFLRKTLTASTEDYILSRRLYLYTPANPRSNWVNKFVDFALSNAGQGWLPVAVSWPRTFSLRLPRSP